MSIRTIIEVNHDLSHRIDDYPEDFIDAINALLSSSNPRTRERVAEFGFRVVESVHHSADRKVVIEGREYLL